MKAGRARDAAAGRTLSGPHRVDLKVTHLAKQQAAERCSTGEQKALLLGIILAHAELVAEQHGQPPVLLLDEVAAAHEKAELFALQRTMNAVGIIVTSATLSLGSLAVTQWVAVAVMAGMAAVVAGAAWIGRRAAG